jgi:uncharacterized paraquat-inducible protein A
LAAGEVLLLVGILSKISENLWRLLHLLIGITLLHFLREEFLLIIAAGMTIGYILLIFAILVVTLLLTHILVLHVLPTTSIFLKRQSMLLLMLVEVNLILAIDIFLVAVVLSSSLTFVLATFTLVVGLPRSVVVIW